MPCFQPLEKICGDLEHLRNRIGQLVGANSNAWLEIEYSGDLIVPNLDEVVNNAIAGSELKVTRLINRNNVPLRFAETMPTESLESMNEFAVFEHCLDARKIPEEQRAELLQAYREIVNALGEDDSNVD